MKRSLATLLIVSFGVSLLLAQEEQGPVDVDELEMQKLLIHRVDPVLPEDTRVRPSATIVLRAVISKTGVVESLQMVSGHPMLVPAALDAARQWRYRHYEVNGIPVRVETTVRVEFLEASEVGTGATGPQGESPVSVTAEEMRDRLVYRVAPVYPPLARQARIQGTVILRLVINQLGEVRDTQLVSGHPMLAPAAVEAVKKWRYMPYRAEEQTEGQTKGQTKGKTVEMQTEVRIIFRLAGS